MSWCVGVGVFTAETQGPQGYAENVQRTPAYLDASSLPDGSEGEHTHTPSHARNS